MDENEFVKLVKDMLAAQVRYFTRGKQFADLNESKRLEKQVDEFIKTHNQPKQARLL